GVHKVPARNTAIHTQTLAVIIQFWHPVPLNVSFCHERERVVLAGSGYHGSMVDWLVVGIGDISTRRVLPAILAEPRSRLAGIVTRDPAKAKPYGVPAWSDLETALV